MAFMPEAAAAADPVEDLTLSPQQQAFFKQLTQALQEINQQAMGALNLICTERGLRNMRLSQDGTQLEHAPAANA
jgi:hypothetical protein